MAAMYLEDGQARVEGQIDYHTVVHLRDEGEAMMRQHPADLTIDFAAVDKVNTAALALLLSWQRTAKELGQDLHFINVPPSLTAIAQMSDLESLLD